MDAVLARDVDLACRRLAEHFAATAAMVRPLAVAASTPEPERADGPPARRRRAAG